MLFHRRSIPGLAIQSYVLGDPESGRGVVIDPVRDVDEYIQVASRHGFQITDIVETHVHADFLSGAAELKRCLEGMPRVHCSAMGGAEWTPRYTDVAVEDGHIIDLGAFFLQALHTPGHTPEHLCWLLYDRGQTVPKSIFSGDLLFAGAVGRPDLLGADAQQTLAKQLYASLFERLRPFPDSVEIFPAHGAGSLCGKAISDRPSTTLGEERAHNTSLVPKPEAEWIDDLMTDMPASPPYFARMKKLNVEGVKPLEDLRTACQGLSAPQVQAELGRALVLDVRDKESFAEGHIPGSINIPLAPPFSNWAAWVLPVEQPVILLLDEPAQLEPVLVALARVGIDEVEGVLQGGWEAWLAAELPYASLLVESVEELHGLTESGEPIILDVRSELEWKEGHIPGARHCPTGMLPSIYAELPKGRPIHVLCLSGYRASIAASLLQREGFHVHCVSDGMQTWNAALLPTSQA